MSDLENRGAEERTGRHQGAPKSKGERTRASLIKAARVIFERHGYVDARVVDIVEEAGVAHGTFYTYFKSKEDIFGVCEELVRDALLEAYKLPPDLDPVQRIRETNRRFIDIYEQNAEMLAQLEQVAQTSPFLKELRLSIRAHFTERLEAAITRMNKMGLTSHPQLPPREAANALGGMVDNTCYVWFGLGLPFDREAMLETLDLIWMRAFGLHESRPSGEQVVTAQSNE